MMKIEAKEVFSRKKKYTNAAENMEQIFKVLKNTDGQILLEIAQKYNIDNPSDLMATVTNASNALWECVSRYDHALEQEIEV